MLCCASRASRRRAGSRERRAEWSFRGWEGGDERFTAVKVKKDKAVNIGLTLVPMCINNC